MPPYFSFTLAAVSEFLKSCERFRSVEGFLSDFEGFTLMQLAAHGTGVGEIVEIGSYLGRSTCFLAAGTLKTGREKVHAVDHFRGSPEHQAGQSFASKVLEEEGTTLHRFHANLRRVGLLEKVSTIQSASDQAAHSWTQSIRLLFIDGDHSYEASRRDFECWAPFVGKHGYVCFHDIGGWPGVTRFYKELLEQTQEFREILTVETLKVIERT
ncbi:MAG: class I SAM-dependent methyltransferase [Gemmataceae bacterium]